MRLIRYEDAEQYYQRIEPFLLEHEAEHNLLLGIVPRLIDYPEWGKHEPYLALVAHEDEIVAAAMITPPYNVDFSGIATEVQSQVLRLYVDDLKGSNWSPPGVLGPKDVSKSFAEQWRAATGQGYRLSRAERIYRLESVKPVVGVSGRFRRATEDDRNLLIDWALQFNIEIFDEHDRERAVDGVDRRLNPKDDVEGMYLWEDGDDPVAFAGATGRTPNGIRIGPVYTPPPLRRRGYASALTAALSQYLLDKGRKFCFLFTDLANPTSNHIYTDIGYVPVCDVDEYKFDDP